MVLAPKARYLTAAWGIAPGCKVEGKTPSAESAIHFKTLVR
jgi:hypothetical protein